MGNSRSGFWSDMDEENNLLRKLREFGKLIHIKLNKIFFYLKE